MNKSPVQIFYDNIEKRKREQLLIQENKPKRGRPRKNKLYFTSDTEEAIIAYNKEHDNTLRNKVYNEYIHYALNKIL